MERVLCITDSLNAGGAETFMMKVYRTLDKTRYQIDFAVSAPGRYDEEVQALGGRVFSLPLRHRHPFRYFSALRRIVRTEGYRRVLKLASTPLAAWDLMAAKAGGASYVGVRSCNASSDEGLLHRMVSGLLRPVFHRITRIKIAPSDLAAAFTFGKKAVAKGQVSFLHNGVDLSLFRFDAEARRSVRASLGIAPNMTLYGHVGRLTKQKNHDFLLDVFHRLQQRDPGARLLLVGTGEREEELRDKLAVLGIADKVIFAGVRTDIPALLSAMDLFIFPSFYEGMPNTVIEAQAVGLACVVSDTITREAGFTDRVQYLPLSDGPDTWASVCEQRDKTHTDTHTSFIENRYAIESVTEDFIKIVYR